MKFLNKIVLFLLLFDSGGGLNYRNIAFAILFGTVFLNIYKLNKINLKKWYLYLILFVSLIPSILISFFNNIEISIVFGWIASFILFPILYLYVKFSKLNAKDFIYSGLFFSIIIIVIFFGRILQIPIIVEFNNFLSENSKGFFKIKYYLNGIQLPNVYFQGTLGLLICGCLAIKFNYNKIFYIIMIALIVAPSRAGFFLLLFYYIVFNLSLYHLKKIFSILLLLLLIAIIIISTSFGNELLTLFEKNNIGMEIRLMHINGLINNAFKTLNSIFFGNGPGSFYYSPGFGFETDNIEISQFEYIRKYGIISFIIFNFFYFYNSIVYENYSRKSSFLILLIYYFVSFTNPVLLSIFIFLFLAYIYNNPNLNENFQHNS